MILHPTISVTPNPILSGYFQITVRAKFPKPLSHANLKIGYPKVTLQGGMVFPPYPNDVSRGWGGRRVRRAFHRIRWILQCDAHRKVDVPGRNQRSREHGGTTAHSVVFHPTSTKS